MKIEFYITKYALTEGIFSVLVEEEDCQERMIVVRDGNQSTYYHGKDYHKTMEQAKIRAFEMIAGKRKSIDKQLKKLEELEKSLCN